MAVGQRTATTANTGSAAASSLSINIPTSTAAGDCLLLELAVNGGTGITITTPTGWTLIQRNNSTTVLGSAVFRRIADGTEGSSLSLSFTSCFASAVMNAYTGVDNNNPIAGITALAKTTASTSATFTGCIPQAENSYAVLFVASRNTTAAQHISTASSGWTTNGDTATTATTFIQAAIMDQHTAGAFPLATFGPAAATLSTTSTDFDMVVVLRPTVTIVTGGFSIDVATFASELNDSGGTVTTAAFNTGYANEIILAVIEGDSGASSVMNVSGAGLTWTAASTFTNARQNTFVYWALASSPLTGATVTATDSGNSASSWGLHVFGILGANTSGPIGATTQTDTNTTAVFTSSLTTTAANSWVWLGWNNYTSNVTPTVGTGQTKVSDIANSGDGNRYSVTRQTAVTASSGTSVTSNSTAPSVKSAGISFEILSGSASANVTQVAATVTATGGTQSVVAITPTSANVTQVAATVTATGGTQSAVGLVKVSANVAQVAANVTAAGGTQSAVGVIAVSATVSQVAANVTAAGGTQTVIAQRNASVTQVATTVTATGGTQATSLVFTAVVFQVAATITVTGGIPVLSAFKPVWTPENVDGVADWSPENPTDGVVFMPETITDAVAWTPENANAAVAFTPEVVNGAAVWTPENIQAPEP